MESALRELAAAMAGPLVLPDDPSFSLTRRLFQARPGSEILPRAVAQCAGPEDVAAALAFARAQRWPFALRSGGHSFADWCTTDGLLIDLAALDSVHVADGTVTVGPGVRLGQLSDRLAEHGRALPCGWHPLVAVGGTVLGGGYGMLGRSYGLGCDHLQAAQVVLADGRVVWTDAEREPDLFWALRGAGWGGFGAVTALVLRTIAAPRVTTFVHRWSWRHVTRVIDAWQHWAPEAPDAVNAELSLQMNDAYAEPRVTLFGAVSGDAGRARPRLAEFLDRVGVGDELDELCELSPRVAASRYTYAGLPLLARTPPRSPIADRPLLRVVKSDFFHQPLPVAAIEELVTTFMSAPGSGQHRELELIPWGGAFGKVPAHATAFVHRTPRFLVGHHGMAGPTAGEDEREAIHSWVDRSWAAVHGWATGGVYPNYPDPELVDWARAYYGDNLPRLMKIKAKYDSTDVFRFAQSVPLVD